MLENEVRRLLTTPVNVPFYRTRASAAQYPRCDPVRLLHTTTRQPGSCYRNRCSLTRFRQASIIFTQYHDVFSNTPLVEVSQVINATLTGWSTTTFATVYSDSILTTLINRALFVQPILPGLPSITHTDGTSRMTLSIGPDESCTRRPSTNVIRWMLLLRRLPPLVRRCFSTFGAWLFRGGTSHRSLVAVQPERVAVSEAYVSPYRMQFRDHIMAPMEDLPVRQLATAVRTIATITPGGANTLFSY